MPLALAEFEILHANPNGNALPAVRAGRPVQIAAAPPESLRKHEVEAGQNGIFHIPHDGAALVIVNRHQVYFLVVLSSPKISAIAFEKTIEVKFIIHKKNSKYSRIVRKIQFRNNSSLVHKRKKEKETRSGKIAFCNV